MWDDFFRIEQDKPYFKKLNKKMDELYEITTVFPDKEHIFDCFKFCEVDNLKVVILGQDPYIHQGEAHGLSFSTKSKKYPPSLKNILTEINENFNINRTNGDFTDLAKQGILFLNTILTVENKKSLSHKNIGWEIFTLNLIEYINGLNKNLVFMLWGNYAIGYEKYLSNKKILILKNSHPSPLSVYRGFKGCKHFLLGNLFLKENKIKEIDYRDKLDEINH